MTTATAKRLVDSRTYTFVVLENGQEAFVHESDLAEGVAISDLTEGTKVTGTDTSTPKGRRLTDVKLVTINATT